MAHTVGDFLGDVLPDGACDASMGNMTSSPAPPASLRRRYIVESGLALIDP